MNKDLDAVVPGPAEAGHTDPQEGAAGEREAGAIPLDLVKEFMERQVAFNHHLGVKVREIGRGLCVLELPFRPEFVGDPYRPALHGGVIATLVDTCGGAAVWSAADAPDRVSTVDLRVDYLRPGPMADLVCEARVLRMGNRVGVAEMRVFPAREPGTLIASGKGVYSVKKGRRPEGRDPAAAPPSTEE